MRILPIILLLVPIMAEAQHTGFSYELMNETGAFSLVSLTFSHRADNSEGITYIIRRQDGDTIYNIDEYLNGYVALSNDGKTVAHLITEKNGKPLDRSIFTFYRDGRKFDTAELKRSIKYQLDERTAKNKIPKSGWLRNDSILHKMATHPFFITDDKVFISFDDPLLMVFDMNRMLHIYTGNGANHFFQNYYSIPNMPYRVEYSSKEYSPRGLPETSSGMAFGKLVSRTVRGRTADEESAKTKVLVEFKLLRDGRADIRKAEVEKTADGKLDKERSASLRSALSETSFSTGLLPPDHPAWIFSGVIWLR